MGWLLNRSLRKAKASSIADFPDFDSARITGRLRLLEAPLKAPLTFRPCAYYELKGERGSRFLADSERSDFLLDDDSGTELVQVKRARIVAERDGHRAVIHVDADTRTREYLRRHGLKDLGATGNEILRQAVSEVWRFGAAGRRANTMSRSTSCAHTSSSR